MSAESAVQSGESERRPLVRGLRAVRSALTSYLSSIERTPWGSFALNKLWPAYLFCLVVLAKADSMRGALANLPARIAQQGSGEVALWFIHQTLTIIFLSLVVVLFIVRAPRAGSRTSFLGAVVAIGGTFALVLMSGAPLDEQPWPLLATASALILAGTLFATISLLTLGTCFGVFPEARGLVTRGPYRWVRHPIYLGELLSGLGLILPHASLQNVAVFALFLGLQYWRALNEERALEAAFPDYAAYRARTWRLAPWLH